VGLRASDIHIEPTAQGFEIRYRVDGLLQTAAKYDAATGRSVVGRLNGPSRSYLRIGSMFRRRGVWK